MCPDPDAIEDERDWFKDHDRLADALARGWQDGVLQDGRADHRIPACEGYQDLQFIARGGQADLYRALTDHGQRVTLKVLRPSTTRPGEIEQRFKLEFQIAQKFDHPHLVRGIAQGQTSQGASFSVFEYVEGQNLHGCLPLQPDTSPWPDLVGVLQFFRQICRALVYAHELGILHRDIKPGNVLVDQNGLAKVIDFGIGRQDEQSGTQFATRTGMFLGSRAYAAPEVLQFGAQLASPQSDVFGLGALLEKLLEGCALPEAGLRLSDLQQVIRHAQVDFPMDRYPSVLALEQDIEAVLHHQRPQVVPSPIQRFRIALRRRKAKLALLLTVPAVLYFGLFEVGGFFPSASLPASPELQNPALQEHSIARFWLDVLSPGVDGEWPFSQDLLSAMGRALQSQELMGLDENSGKSAEHELVAKSDVDLRQIHTLASVQLLQLQARFHCERGEQLQAKLELLEAFELLRMNQASESFVPFFQLERVRLLRQLGCLPHFPGVKAANPLIGEGNTRAAARLDNALAELESLLASYPRDPRILKESFLVRFEQGLIASNLVGSSKGLTHWHGLEELALKLQDAEASAGHLQAEFAPLAMALAKWTQFEQFVSERSSGELQAAGMAAWSALELLPEHLAKRRISLWLRHSLLQRGQLYQLQWPGVNESEDVQLRIRNLSLQLQGVMGPEMQRQDLLDRLPSAYRDALAALLEIQ